MRDLIDREELIYSLECIPFYHEFWKVEGCEGLWQSEDVENCIKNMPSVQQWTPVSEGLPEKEGEVLVTTSWGNVCMAWCDNGKWRAEYINGYDDDEILAWMPLPEPFKGGDEK